MTLIIFPHPLFKSSMATDDPEQRPVDLILGEHYRQRLLVNELLDLSSDLPNPYAAGTARLILYHLFEKRHAHEEFEDDEVAPLLRWRCQPSDNLESLLAKIAWDRLIIGRYAQKVRSGLMQIAKGDQLPDIFEFRHNVKQFAFKLKEHIIWKNRDIIPLARKRLNANDLAYLALQISCREHNNAGPALAM